MIYVSRYVNVGEDTKDAGVVWLDGWEWGGLCVEIEKTRQSKSKKRDPRAVELEDPGILTGLPNWLVAR